MTDVDIQGALVLACMFVPAFLFVLGMILWEKRRRKNMSWWKFGVGPEAAKRRHDQAVFKERTEVTDDDLRLARFIAEYKSEGKSYNATQKCD